MATATVEDHVDLLEWVADVFRRVQENILENSRFQQSEVNQGSDLGVQKECLAPQERHEQV